MDTLQRKAHWEKVFKTKDTTKVSWHQLVPETSLRLIQQLNIPKDAKIIEVGSGDSFLVDHLLEREYENITLLDISEKALETVKNRLAEKAFRCQFLAKDITTYSEHRKFDVWHDRAVFHFLTDKDDIKKYVHNATESIKEGGYLIIGTFSNNGPDMCSGLNVQQYSEDSITETFKSGFTKIKCFTENHTTPSGGVQNFLFGIFQRSGFNPI